MIDYVIADIQHIGAFISENLQGEKQKDNQIIIEGEELTEEDINKFDNYKKNRQKDMQNEIEPEKEQQIETVQLTQPV